MGPAEDIIRFCIVDLEVTPVADGWDDELRASYELFRSQFSRVGPD